MAVTNKYGRPRKNEFDCTIFYSLFQPICTRLSPLINKSDHRKLTKLGIEIALQFLQQNYSNVTQLEFMLNVHDVLSAIIKLNTSTGAKTTHKMLVKWKNTNKK
jgi:hypothetical protein